MNNPQSTKRSALGKGFTSLMGLEENDANSLERSAAFNPGLATKNMSKPSAEDMKNSIMQLNVEDIEPNPHQPRRIFDDDALKSLSQSILEDGVIQPVIVSTQGSKPGKYMMIAGERRWRASRMAGLTSVPAIVKEGSPETILRLALIENIQRADLSIIEEAEAYASLIRDYGLTQEQCAQKLGKDRTTITNALRLLSLPKEVQDDLIDGRITMGHGRALLSLEDKKAILRARDIVVKKQLNVRRTEQLCKRFKLSEDIMMADPKAAAELSADDADLDYLAESLRGHLKTKVRISGNGSRGKIEVSYFSPAELERIVALMGI